MNVSQRDKVEFWAADEAIDFTVNATSLNRLDHPRYKHGKEGPNYFGAEPEDSHVPYVPQSGQEDAEYETQI